VAFQADAVSPGQRPARGVDGLGGGGHAGGAIEELPGIAEFNLASGTLFVLQTPGGDGFGEPA
jgi:N-methylhydantoinase B/oxoprolinase/acetone carboxylase alpha subunit